MAIDGMDFEEPIVHATGQQQPVTVATFAGVRITHWRPVQSFAAIDTRPWPERMEEEIWRLDAQVQLLQREQAALIARLDGMRAL